MLDSPSGEMVQCSRLSHNSTVVSPFMRLLRSECVNTVVEMRQLGEGKVDTAGSRTVCGICGTFPRQKRHAGCSNITGDGGNVNGHGSEDDRLE